MYLIYALKLKNTEDLSYIGRTSKSLNERLKSHLRSIKYDKKKTHRHYWIMKHYENIEIVLIEDNISTFEESCEKEIFYISKYREKYKLINLTNGGDGGCPGYKHTEEFKKMISLTHKGKIYSEEVRQKMRKPKNISEEDRLRKIELYRIKFKGEGNPMWGKKRPDNIERNKSRSGEKRSEEVKQKMREMRKGEKHPCCRLSKEDALICIKMKRCEFTLQEISSKFGMKISYIKNLTSLKYKRKDINYDRLDEILEMIEI